MCYFYCYAKKSHLRLLFSFTYAVSNWEGVVVFSYIIYILNPSTCAHVVLQCIICGYVFYFELTCPISEEIT